MNQVSCLLPHWQQSRSYETTLPAECFPGHDCEHAFAKLELFKAIRQRAASSARLPKRKSYSSRLFVNNGTNVLFLQSAL